MRVVLRWKRERNENKVREICRMREPKGSKIIIPVNWIQYHSGIPTQSKDIRVSQLLPRSQVIIFDVA